MKVISIKQPWASLIAHGIKDIENRTWTENDLRILREEYPYSNLRELAGKLGKTFNFKMKLRKTKEFMRGCTGKGVLKRLINKVGKWRYRPIEGMVNKPYLYRNEEVVIISFCDVTGDDGDLVEIY